MSATASTTVTPEALAWDRDLAAIGGHLLQSWRWGTFKQQHGWHPERVAVRTADGQAFAQVLFRRKGPVSIGYIPRGPAFSSPDPNLARALFAEVDRVCRSQRAISLIVEPDQPLPFTGGYKENGFVRAATRIQPGRTVKVPLIEDEPLLAQMHHKHRYNIRLSQRKGVETAAVPCTPENLKTYYDMMQDTSARNEFGIHSQQYYGDFLEAFGDDAALMFSWVEGVPASALIVARFGNEGIYMYGASSTANRAHGAAALLQFEAMRWSREQGCALYDLWGIPEEDPNSTSVSEGDRVAPTRGEDLRGLFEFKVRFGGSVVTYPPALERRYLPVVSALASRVYRTAG